MCIRDSLFIDAVCIPKGCRNKEAAEMYTNFLNEPDVAYAIADFIGYSTPNQKAYEMLDDEVKNDGISYLCLLYTSCYKSYIYVYT